MELLREIDDYIKETIDHTLGLPVSTQTLELKLRASEEARHRLRGQNLDLQVRLKEKDELIDRARAESSMNAQALRKFVDENQKLAMECASLLGRCERLEKECSLYHKDREALMDFGNEADERARRAELQVLELEEELNRMRKEVQSYKYQHKVESSSEGLGTEQHLLDSLLTTLVENDKVNPTHAFQEACGGLESFQSSIKVWNSLRPSTRKAIVLVDLVKTLEKDKEHLRTNLTRAEEEVNLLFEENKLLDKENKRLMRQQREKCNSGSGENCTTSVSVKGNKRKFSPIKGEIEYTEGDSPRKPLSSLPDNSPDSRMYKK